MGTFRINHNTNYTVVSNRHLRDKEMSLKAKGLLTLMLSLPDDWNYSIEGLVKLSKDGKGSVTNGLYELEKLGYMTRTQTKDSKGQFNGYDWEVYESPVTENPLTENPPTVNPTQINTTKIYPYDITNNKYINKEKESKYIVEIAEVIDYLNEKLGTEYRAKSRVNRECITARLNEGFTVDDFKKVIDNKYEDWGGTDMELYLRPQTLFGTKFETYLNASTGKRKSKIEKPTMGIWLG